MAIQHFNTPTPTPKVTASFEFVSVFVSNCSTRFYFLCSHCFVLLPLKTPLSIFAALNSPTADHKVNFLVFLIPKFPWPLIIKRQWCMGIVITLTSPLHTTIPPTALHFLPVYRSIDNGEEEIVVYREAMRKKQDYSYQTGAKVRGGFKSEEAMANFQRAYMIEKWMEKKAGEKIVVRSNSVADLQKKKSRKDRENSSSSSSDSSCGGGNFFTSSEAESFPLRRPKPVRTRGSVLNHCDFGANRRRDFADQLDQKPKHESGFLKTKYRDLKIYGDLKKVKQPISPGGRLARFLNSIFTNRNSNKPKTTSNCDDPPSLKSATTSTCSSASSFSRSCLSTKTPSSSSGKSSNCTKRSVRFFPISVIVDEDCQPCGHKSLQQESNYHYTINNGEYKKQSSNSDLTNCKNRSIRNIINDELKVHVLEENRRVEVVARDLLRNCQEFEDDDDAASYASSDLFELDNLSAIGMEKYRELPVYETTHLTSRAIVNGLIL